MADTELLRLQAIETAATAYVECVNGEPEKDCWDTEDGEEAPGAERFASDWSWQEYDTKKQSAFDYLRHALALTPTPVPDAEGHKRGLEAVSAEPTIDEFVAAYCEARGAVLCDAQPVAHVTDTGDRLDVCFEQRVSVDVVAGDLLFAALRTPKTEA